MHRRSLASARSLLFQIRLRPQSLGPANLLVLLQDQDQGEPAELRELHGKPPPRLCRQSRNLYGRRRARGRFPRPLRNSRGRSRQGASHGGRCTQARRAQIERHAQQGDAAGLPQLLHAEDRGGGARLVRA